MKDVNRKQIVTGLLILLLTVGCATTAKIPPTKITIPPEPIFERFMVYNLPSGGIYMDKEGVDILEYNIYIYRVYQEELLKLLKKAIGEGTI